VIGERSRVRQYPRGAIEEYYLLSRINCVAKVFLRMSHIAYLDCQAGVSCEALLGALLDAGLSLDVLKQRLASLPLREYDLMLEHVRDEEMHGTSVKITLTSQNEIEYNWSELEMLLAAPQTPASIREATLAILRRLIMAEAKVRSEESSFTIKITSLVILIAVIIGLEELCIAQLYASALPLTSGYVQAPAPVTLELLHKSGAIWKPTIPESEGVTSIVAALLVTLARFDAPPFTIERVGYGVNAASPLQANFLRLYVGKLQNAEAHDGREADTDWVTVLSTNIDNMSGELLGGLMERLFDAGALDVSYTPMQMKKNRPATMLMLVCPLEKGDELAYILLRETTTLGVRIQQVQRLKAQRTPQQIDTPLGSMLVKVKRLGTQIISAAPEYEECQRIAREQNMPLADVYAVAQHWIAQTIIDNREK